MVHMSDSLVFDRVYGIGELQSDSVGRSVEQGITICSDAT